MKAQSQPRIEPEPVTPDEEPRRPLLVISLLPSAATLGNLLCGFMAIFCCLLSMRWEYAPAATVPTRVLHPTLLDHFPTYVAAGAWLIVAAMIFDALDGRLARIARRVTEFGAQFDSIADVVSFGAAPALLFLTMLIQLAKPADNVPVVSKAQWALGLICALVFLSCAAIRLARYNAENIRDESHQRKFTGLPTPGAAAAFVTLLVLHEMLMKDGANYWGVDWAAVVRWASGPIAFGLGVLMVSRLDFAHVFNTYLRIEHPPSHLIGLVIALGIGLFSPELLLLLAAYGYVVSGLLVNLARWWRPADQAPALARSQVELKATAHESRAG